MMSAPFCKYVGGKRALVPTILPLLQLGRATSYVEPFLGGGAVFLVARDEGGFRGPCILNDANRSLIVTWAAIRRDPDAVLQLFLEHAERDSREYFYSVRQDPPTTVNAHAAWFLYLNKRAFNGIWRVNRKGLFNVPYGNYKRPPTLDEVALRAAHVALRDATIRLGDFEDFEVAEGASVYADPPYVPVSETANFTGYTRDGFNADDQVRLARWCRELADRGCRVVLSNAAGSVADQAFAPLADEVLEVEERRAVNRDGGKRGAVETRIYVFGDLS